MNETGRALRLLFRRLRVAMFWGKTLGRFMSPYGDWVKKIMVEEELNGDD